MTAIPRAPRNLRHRFVWERLTVSPLYSLTEWLMSGSDPIPDEDQHDLEELFRAVDAVKRAYKARKRAAGITEDVLEE